MCIPLGYILKLLVQRHPGPLPFSLESLQLPPAGIVQDLATVD